MARWWRRSSAASGLPAREWLRSYLRAYVRPVVHCLLAHDLAFMPHGENLVLVLRDHVPVRAIMKDIGEEVAVLGDQPLPPEAERVRHKVTDDVQALALHTDVFDGVLRHLAAILARRRRARRRTRSGTLVAGCVRGACRRAPRARRRGRRTRPVPARVRPLLPQPAPAAQHARRWSTSPTRRRR